MRKLGFTLAEVLITLGIIGVIATLTLPTLMANTAEREYSTALKKAVANLTEAIQINLALENTTFDELYDQSDVAAGEGGNDNGGGNAAVGDANNVVFSTEVNSLYAFMCNRMQTEKNLTLANACDDTANASTCINYSGNEDLTGRSHVMYFRDGSALIYQSTDTIETDRECTTYDGAREFGQCFIVWYDVNGNKKPNLIANCDGDKSRSAGDGRDGEGNADNAAACTKENFVARDQYRLMLTGGEVHPYSNPAAYIFNKK